MKSLSAIRPLKSVRCLSWVMICLALSWLSGCQSMMVAKQKPKGPIDHFSCGEKVPVSSVPRSALQQ